MVSVSGYSMQDNTAILHGHIDKQTQRIPLTNPQSLIVVERLNYALQMGAMVNTMVLNAFELLDRQNETIVACGRSTLEIKFVRRQHVVGCELGRRSSSATDVFTDPQLAQPETSATSYVPTNASANAPETSTLDLVFSDSDDETKTDVPPTQQADIDLVRLQNRPLRKRNRDAESDHDILFPDDDDIPVLDGFYNSTVSKFIKAGVSFTEQLALLSRPNTAICNSLASWIYFKLGKFRGEVIASNLQTAALIAKEFTRNDDRLMERVQAHHKRQLTALVVAKVA
ncbi:hypothetical protein DVH05_020094 [Phytophthora capsici]|nr:hypothetical protein DVH05_020094 [Phytophthora capsici]